MSLVDVDWVVVSPSCASAPFVDVDAVDTVVAIEKGTVNFFNEKIISSIFDYLKVNISRIAISFKSWV